MTRRLTLMIFALLALTLAACGPRSGAKGPDLDDLPALRWVPAGTTYVAVITRGDAAVTGARDLTEVFGMLADFDATEVGTELRKEIGVDLLSLDDLAAAGIDTAAGGVLWSQGLSPTLVFHLADPARMAGRIEERRSELGNGTAVASSIRDKVEVYTLMGGDVHTHWAIDGEWMWVHFEIVDEKEPELGWFDASRAAKGIAAKDADLAWARAQAAQLQPGAGIIASIRLADVMAKAIALIDNPEATACLGLVTPRRAAVTMGTTAGVAEGHVTVDLTGTGGAAAIAQMTLPVPQGWAAATASAPLVAEWNVDLAALARIVNVCEDDLEEAVTETGFRAVRGFLVELDADFNGKAALSADLAHKRWIDARMDFTGRSMFESKQTFGGIAGKRLDAPMVPAIDYILDDKRAMAGLGDGVLAGLVGDGTTVPATVLGRIDVRPGGLSEGAWDVLLQYGAGIGRDEARARTVRRLQRWKQGTVKMSLDGETLHVSARGER